MTIDIPRSPEDMPTSNLRFIGRRVLRKEDPSLLTGRTEFIADVSLRNMLHAAILRSPIAHARVTRVDVSEAEALPGVVAVLTGADAARWSNLARSVPEGWATPVMATDIVRYVGEPVVAVAATSRYVAEDALERIEVDYEPLEVVSDPFAALEPDSPLVHEHHGTNMMMHRVFTWGAIDEALEGAAHVFTERFRWNRLGANPMETYGTVCQWDPASLEVNIRGSIQSPGFTALGRAGVLGVPANKVNVHSHPHGGAFGGKGGSRGTDITCMLSRMAGGRPVSWIEDRVEYLTSGGGQAWDRHYEVSLAVGDDGIVSGLKVTLVDDLGASGEGFGAISAAKPLAAFTGPYAIPVAQYDLTLVATNKLPASPYRGMGPPPHFFVLEHMMDLAARRLGIDPTELRRRNFIRPEQFPYTIPSGNEYDSGSYEEVLDAALELAGYEELRRWQAEARAEGRLVGIGVATAVEPGVFDWNAYAIVGMPQTGVPEGAVVSVDMLGNFTVRVGFSHEGQGQYTLVSQVVADYFGVEMDSVRVVYLDSGSAPPSFGPGGSRLGVAITGAVLGACEQLAQRMGSVVARLTGSDPDDVSLHDGRFVIKGKPQAEMSVAQVAGTMLARSDLLPEGVAPNTDATHVWTAEGRTPADDQGRAKSYLTGAQAVHVAAVEIDRRTGVVQIHKYCLADDCGTRLNPVVVEGQTDGGVAQGVGAALYEEYAYDDQAQPLTTSFMDYLVPTIHEVPPIEKTEVVTPSPFTPLGAKGCGEGAIHTTPATIMCAINDALAPLGATATEVPASPERLWRLIRDAERAGERTDGSDQR